MLSAISTILTAAIVCGAICVLYNLRIKSRQMAHAHKLESELSCQKFLLASDNAENGMDTARAMAANLATKMAKKEKSKANKAEYNHQTNEHNATAKRLLSLAEKILNEKV